MTKLLSIIIPTYNMEALLPRCLDSLLVDGALELIEAIVVNDGSKDGSLAVAKSYQERFPDSVTVIDKPNGNYGSTINAALPLAKGKYVKVLDSDDWFNSDALVQYIDSLKNTDADFILTHFTIIHPGGKKELAKYNLYGKEPYEYGKNYSLDYVLGGGYIRFFMMHAITYRTEMLRQNNYVQTEGISYTDLEWDTYPLFYAKDVVFFNFDLYQYNMDREGQTMDPKVLNKSIAQQEKITSQILAFLENRGIDGLSNERQTFLRQYYLNRLRLICKSHLFDIEHKDFNAEHFAQLVDGYQKVCEKFGLGEIKLYPENKLIRCNAMKYWHKHHKRWPAWFELFNKGLNVIMSKLYMLFFR
ncbi:MAG: glycosyltransferase family 2 protein [Salinivirgaceae bacterium]|nr:glycosyltransferase family 2 protein [Salinivirgaceae bacterium]